MEIQIRFEGSAGEWSGEFVEANSGKTIALNEDNKINDAPITIKFGGANRTRGVNELLIFIYASIDFVNLGIGVVSGVIANWLWSNIKSTDEKTQLQIILMDKSGMVTKILKLKSKENLSQDIKDFINENK